MSRTYHRRSRVRRTFCSVSVPILCSLLLLAAPAAHAQKKVTVAGELKRLQAEGADPAAIAAPTAPPTTTLRARVKKLTGARKVQLGGVVTDLEGMAARKQFTRQPPPEPVPHAPAQHRVVDDAARCSAAGERVGFTGSELVFQFYPGHGIQIQWLGHVRQAQRLLERRQALRRPGQRAAGRDQGPVRPARRRPRVGVPVPVRRPAAAVGLLARPGHRPAGDGPLRHAPKRQEDVFPVALRRPRHLQDRAARRRADPVRHRRPLPAVLRAAERSRSPTASSSRSSASTTSPTLTGDPTAQSLFEDGDRAGRAEIRHVRHRRLEPLQPRRADHARVRPRLPQAPARLPQGAVLAHDRGRVLRRRAALQRVPDHAAGAAVAHAARSPRARVGQHALQALEDLAGRRSRSRAPASPWPR